MTVHEALVEGIKALRYFALPSAELDAEVLLAAILRTTKEDLARRPEREVAKTRLAKYQHAILRRGKHEPVAYITGRKEFYGRDFVVSNHVLVPRPESELLIEEALKRLPPDQHCLVADIGTGSGCLAVTLACERPKIHVVATDIMPEALRVAQTNAIRHRVASRVDLVHGDFLHAIHQRHVDLCIANLPYVPESEVLANPDLMYEPIIALRGKLGPEKTFAEFLRQWFEREQRPATLIEIHPNQARQVLKENEKIGVHVQIRKDLAGRNRVAILESKYESLLKKETAPGEKPTEG